jgi:hypothetical protein
MVIKSGLVKVDEVQFKEMEQVNAHKLTGKLSEQANRQLLDVLQLSSLND